MTHPQCRMKAWLMAGVAVACLAAPLMAAAQNTQTVQSGPTGAPPAAQAPAASADSTVVVVTGFRSSLKSALNLKKNSAGTVDAIMSEDIAKFPDSNLAESMQRIPGVTLSRGDGGEGRNISVRGLGPTFTRVRINGLEGSSQTGSSDIYGAGNNGRSFDFNVFPTEIFSALAARKTPSADVEEGSLGATVDLKAPHPFDYRADSVLSFTARGVYNEVSKQTDPRVSLLFSKKFGDGKWGILGSYSYSHRNIREVGYSSVDILSAGLGGNGLGSGATVQPFCTPIGYTPVSPSPVTYASKGADANNCATGDPRTGDLSTYNAIMAMRSAAAPNTPASGAFFPRIPRYVNSTQDETRQGGNLTLQWRPDSATDISLDLLYSKYQDERDDNYIEPVSFARNINNNGQPMVSVKSATFSSNGSLLSGVFDGVDVRSEGLVDQFTSKFAQANLNFMHRFNDRFMVSGVIGANQSNWDGPMRLQTFMDAIDTKNFSIDFGGDSKKTPVIKFGFDVNNPANFSYAPAAANGDVLGGFSVQGKPQFNVTMNKTANLDFRWDATPDFALKFGGQYKVNDFNSHSLNLLPSEVAVQALPAGVTLASLTTHITGLDDLWGHGAPASWVSIDSAKWRAATGFDNLKYCGVECGAAKTQLKETITGAYVMGDFHYDHLLPIPVRGDVGMRYVHTDEVAVGYLPVPAAAGATYPTVGQRKEVDRDYADWLPSANVVFEFTPNVLFRVSAAKVMARPDLTALTPSASVTATTRNITISNPDLDPIRANTIDASLEWYFKPGSLLSAGLFYKDIKSFIQRVNSQEVYNTVGLPDAILNNTNSAPTDIFTVGRLVNTPGGPLKGIELNYQGDLDFLPGRWKNLGVLANYTHVTSQITYDLATANGVPTVTTIADLTGLSRDSASGTIYYEDKDLSVRFTGTYRGKYIRGIPASSGSDLQGNDDTFYLDGSLSFNLNKNLKLILEGQNLTDEKNRLYIDSTRQDTLFETRIGRTFTFGFTYKY